jgi:hypothetical protein
MIRHAIEFLGTCAAAWLSIGSIRLATHYAHDLALWLVTVAMSCIFGLSAVLLVSALVASAVRAEE